MEKYRSSKEMVDASNFLKNCWVKNQGSQFKDGVIPIIDGVYFNNNQDNVLTHLAIVNGNY